MFTIDRYNSFTKKLKQNATYFLSKLFLIKKKYNRLTIDNKYFINLNNLILRLNKIIEQNKIKVLEKDIEIDQLKIDFTKEIKSINKLIEQNKVLIFKKDIEINQLKIDFAETISSSNNLIEQNKVLILEKDIEINHLKIYFVEKIESTNKLIEQNKNIEINELNVIFSEKIKAYYKSLTSKYDILVNKYTDIVATINMDVISNNNILFEHIIYLEAFSNGYNTIRNIFKIIVFKNLNFICYEGTQTIESSNYYELVFNAYPLHCYIKQDNSIKITNKSYIEKIKKIADYIFNTNINGNKDFEEYIEIIVDSIREKRNIKLQFIEDISVIYPDRVNN